MSTPKIESYSFGEIVIDGRRYRRDLIVYPDHVGGQWWREAGHSLLLEDFWDVLKIRPEVLIVGQGSLGQMTAPLAVRNQLSSHGVQLIAEDIAHGCDINNHLNGQRRVTAASNLSC